MTLPADTTPAALDPQSRCPCGSGDIYGGCCLPLHRGRPAATAEALMRSRFSAFAVGDDQHLLRTWHPDTRPDTLDLDDTPGLRWLGLDVKRHEDGGDGSAVVEFVARHRIGGGKAKRLHEVSRFARVDGRWLYVDGEFK